MLFPIFVVLQLPNYVTTEEQVRVTVGLNQQPQQHLLLFRLAEVVCTVTEPNLQVHLYADRHPEPIHIAVPVDT